MAAAVAAGRGQTVMRDLLDGWWEEEEEKVFFHGKTALKDKHKVLVPQSGGITAQPRDGRRRRRGLRYH